MTLRCNDCAEEYCPIPDPITKRPKYFYTFEESMRWDIEHLLVAPPLDYNKILAQVKEILYDAERVRRTSQQTNEGLQMRFKF